MNRKVVSAVFALVLFSLSLVGCRSQELCPAYTDNTTAQEEKAEMTV